MNPKPEALLNIMRLWELNSSPANDITSMLADDIYSALEEAYWTGAADGGMDNEIFNEALERIE